MEFLKSLDWDSAFFGFRIARIVNSHASPAELQQAVTLMRSRGITLAYWAADQPGAEVRQQAQLLGGVLVDEKQTYAADLDNLAEDKFDAMALVEPWQQSMDLAALKDLAVQSGGHSRFFVDQRFPRDKARAMFEEWIVRSIDGTLAEQVFVIRHDERPVGLVTLSRNGSRGSIGLLSVAEGFRGRYFGESLVRTALNWCRAQGLGQVQVITQGVNIAAGNLYRKCGFKLEESASVFHFWA